MMRPRLAVVLPLVLGLATLSALGHATPPDPTWIGGVYDAADGDDVVGIAAFADLAADPDSSDRLQPLWVLLGGVETRPPTARLAAPRLVFQGRAPPSV